MQLTSTSRGFEILKHDVYPPKPEPMKQGRLAQQSSAVGDYEDAIDCPGTSYLWIGDNFHLDREEVRSLVEHLQRWLDTGSMEVEEAKS